jgi:glycosyltransferase involved in cell wall biosynthesis
MVADSPQAFARSVLRLLEDRGPGEAMAQAGRKLIRERYGWDVVLSRLEEVYITARERPI